MLEVEQTQKHFRDLASLEDHGSQELHSSLKQPYLADDEPSHAGVATAAGHAKLPIDFDTVMSIYRSCYKNYMKHHSRHFRLDSASVRRYIDIWNSFQKCSESSNIDNGSVNKRNKSKPKRKKTKQKRSGQHDKVHSLSSLSSGLVSQQKESQGISIYEIACRFKIPPMKLTKAMLNEILRQRKEKKEQQQQQQHQSVNSSVSKNWKQKNLHWQETNLKRMTLKVVRGGIININID